MLAGGLYYHGAHAVLMAYDVTNSNSFENVETWNDKFDDRDEEGIQTVPKVITHNPPIDIDTVKVLVGCKSDMEDTRQVRRMTRHQFLCSQ